MVDESTLVFAISVNTGMFAQMSAMKKLPLVIVTDSFKNVPPWEQEDLLQDYVTMEESYNGKELAVKGAEFLGENSATTVWTRV